MQIMMAVLLLAAAGLAKASSGGHAAHPWSYAATTAAASALRPAVCHVTEATHSQLPPFPIRADDVCGSLGLNKPYSAYGCLTFAALGPEISNPKLRCAPDAIPMPPDTDAQGLPMPLPLPDRRVKGELPTFLDTQTVLQQEGSTLWWLQAHVQRIYTWAVCGLLGNDAAWVPPPGWRLLKMVRVLHDPERTVNDARLRGDTSPMMAILSQDAGARARGRAACLRWARGLAASLGGPQEHLCDGGHLLFVIRGTTTAYEWTVDYNYNMRHEGSFGPGAKHVGFVSMAEQLWEGGMRAALESEVLRAGSGVQHITITGHSMGAATTALLSARAQAFLEARGPAAGRAVPRVAAAMFGGPNTGDAAFAAAFNRAANGRNVQFVYDIISQVPCSPQVGCHNTAVPTPTAAGAWPYERVGGRVQLDAAAMPVQRDVWARLAVLSQRDYCEFPGATEWVVDATHYCSYACRLGAYAGRQDWCRLWPEGGGGGGAPRDAFFCLQGVPGSEWPKAGVRFPREDASAQEALLQLP